MLLAENYTYVSGAMSGILVIAFCLVTPAFLVCGERGKFLISWKEFAREYPWTLLFIVGGGFAISEASIVQYILSSSVSTL